MEAGEQLLYLSGLRLAELKQKQPLLVLTCLSAGVVSGITDRLLLLLCGWITGWVVINVSPENETPPALELKLKRL